jgi:hypothetical protein
VPPLPHGADAQPIGHIAARQIDEAARELEAARYAPAAAVAAQVRGHDHMTVVAKDGLLPFLSKQA